MTESNNIVASAACKPVSHSPVVVVGCPMVYTVTYNFTIYSQKGDVQRNTKGRLVLPYAVAINGRIHSQYANNPKKLDLEGVKNVTGSITVNARLGETVTLYLGSDASADWRQQPLYAVTLNDKSAVVHITEKEGLQTDTDKPKARPSNNSKADEYDAALTGNIWMRFSHRYSVGEVDSRLPAGTSAEVAAAVKSIYEGLRTGLLTVQRKGADGAAQQISLHFPVDKSDNCHSNIRGFDMLSDGLTRVHPGGYAALINAALDNGVGSVKMSSCWRPMLGSIAHRLGLGLDVNFLEAVQLNRQELIAGQPKTAAADANVSEDEKLFYKAWLQARKERETAREERYRLDKVGNDDEKKAAADRLRKAQDNEVAANAAWDEERNKHEPPKVKAFRKSLYTCPCVRQLYDPWYMDHNTRDKVPAQPNTQQTSNETLHAHHLHITVLDTKVLP